MSSDNMPSRWLYRASAAVLILGVAAGFAWFNWALDDQTRRVGEFQRLPPRSGIPVEIEAPGVYTVWGGAACGGFCDVPPVSEMQELVILGFEGPGGVVRPEPFPGSQSYRIDGSQHGTAVWIVEFDEAGTYVLERQNLGVGSVNLLLGEGVGMPTRITSGLITIAIVTFGLSAALATVAWYRRRRAVLDMVERIHGNR